MFFVVVLALLLYVYRYFRKVGSAVESRFILTSDSKEDVSTNGSSSLPESLSRMSDANRPAIWSAESGANISFLQLRNGESVQEESLRWAVKLAQIDDSTVVERVLDGVKLSKRDSVRISPSCSIVSAQLLRWQLVSGTAPAVVASQMSSSEATVIATKVAEIRQCLAVISSKLEAKWFGRWAWSLANDAAKNQESALLKRAFFDMKMVIAETLLFPSAIASTFSPRATHLFVDKKEEALSVVELATLHCFGMTVHRI